MSDVVLTAALRNNLLSLQATQALIDVTQYRLSTGKKVNSALDNPQNFFASKSLSNRAGDLQRLLDGIGQSIQTIKAADNAVTGLTKLIEQADSVAQSAKDAISQGTT
ncbi:MAG TPA: flagellin, partial [Alphaproteobacteria bacterium]|nr:flagellin [Alphaproteobacteria bacterium]